MAGQGKLQDTELSAQAAAADQLVVRALAEIMGCVLGRQPGRKQAVHASVFRDIPVLAEGPVHYADAALVCHEADADV